MWEYMGMYQVFGSHGEANGKDDMDTGVIWGIGLFSA